VTKIKNWCDSIQYPDHTSTRPRPWWRREFTTYRYCSVLGCNRPCSVEGDVLYYTVRCIV